MIQVVYDMPYDNICYQHIASKPRLYNTEIYSYVEHIEQIMLKSAVGTVKSLSGPGHKAPGAQSGPKALSALSTRNWQRRHASDGAPLSPARPSEAADSDSNFPALACVRFFNSVNDLSRSLHRNRLFQFSHREFGR